MVEAVILENDVNYRNVYISCFKKLGANVISSTADPMSALKIIAERQPKLLIMDIVLPEVDGFEFAKTVRALAPATKILILTYLVNDRISKDCEKIGVERYINKPIKPDLISFIISQYVGFETVRKNFKPIAKAVSSVDEAILDRILQELQLPFHIQGTRYTRVAIKYMLKQEVPLDKILITKEVYPTVAKECNTTPSKVERAIRYCVNFILEKETMDIVSPDKYGVNINGNHKLSNSKFLMILARHVLDKLAEANACDDISILNMRVN